MGPDTHLWTSRPLGHLVVLLPRSINGLCFPNRSLKNSLRHSAFVSSLSQIRPMNSKLDWDMFPERGPNSGSIVCISKMVAPEQS